MITSHCPTCKKPGFEVYFWQGFYYCNDCQEQVEPDFDVDKEYE